MWRLEMEKCTVAIFQATVSLQKFHTITGQMLAFPFGNVLGKLENMKRKFRFITKNLDGVPEVSKDTAAFLHLFTSFPLGQEMQLYCFGFCCVY